MTRWEDYFEIKDGDIGSMYKYNLVNKATGEVVGTYEDYSYAKKQAKYKFKKILNKVEKILLG